MNGDEIIAANSIYLDFPLITMDSDFKGKTAGVAEVAEFFDKKTLLLVSKDHLRNANNQQTPLYPESCILKPEL